jgi:Mce-associated membrane protein
MVRSGRSVGASIALGLLALGLVAVALWAAIAASGQSGEADRLRADADRLTARAQDLTRGADVDNRALIDVDAQGDAVRQLREAVEKSFSYDYTDLGRTEQAVRDNLVGKARCEYDNLFGEVKRLAPEQKIILTTTVREAGVTRLAGDTAELLAFVDQRTSRADQDQTTASGGQFAIRAQRQGARWKITELDFLGQPLPNGKPAPQC